MISDFHGFWGWIAIALCGLAGVWGLLLAVLRLPPGRVFPVLAGAGMVAIFLQVVAGLLLLGAGRQPPAFHVFYGVVILFTLSFAYIYRPQLNRRPVLYWGLLMLFVMGLGIRAVTELS